MKYYIKINKFLLIIFFFSLFLFLFLILKKNNIDNFENNKYIILLGDSILNNSNYVNEKLSVYNIVKNKNLNTYLLAEDGATINRLDKQIEQLKEFPYEKLNNNNTYIFISIGGNDILEGNISNNKKLENLLNNYLNKIKIVKIKYPKTNLYLLNLYKPLKSKYEKYYKIIETWNNLLEKEKENNKNIYKILDISKIIIYPNDLVYSIEPSINGGKKIAEEILNKL